MGRSRGKDDERWDKEETGEEVVELMEECDGEEEEEEE